MKKKQSYIFAKQWNQATIICNKDRRHLTRSQSQTHTKIKTNNILMDIYEYLVFLQDFTILKKKNEYALSLLE